ncbi:MAG: hypothetical protein SNJ54_06080 [Anaerolineae bacterium]
MATREQNERRFKNWQDLPNGGRRYWTDRKGAISGFQRIIKINVLIERHQKFPLDAGHEKLVDED